MVVQSVPLSESQKVYLRVSGDLTLEGGPQGDLTLHGERGDFRVEQMESQVVVVCSGGLRAVLPAQGHVMVERASGSVFVRGTSCDLKMERISGDLTVDGAEHLWVERVGGQTTARKVPGSLVLGKVGGDLICEEIGSLTTSKVGGEAHLRQVGLGGDMHCGGDLLIAPTQCAVPSVTLHVGGDVMMHLLPELNAEVLLNSEEREIYLNFGEQHSELNVKKHLLTLGTGGAQLTIFAGGELMLTDQAWEGETVWENASENRPWREVMELDGFGQKMRGKVERKMGRMARKGMFVPPIPPIPPIPSVPLGPKMGSGAQAEPREGVTSDERLMVLQMLQEGKINAEQADLLLSALRG